MANKNEVLADILRPQTFDEIVGQKHLFGERGILRKMMEKGRMMMKNKKQNAQRLALLGLCASVALLLSYVEALFPPLFAAVPGIKMGLPNIAIIFVLYRYGLRDAALVSLVRLVVVAMLFGSAMTFLYSLAGAVLSLAVMTLLKRRNFLSTVGVSVAGGVFHNAGQILVAMVLLRTAEIGYYMIVLAITGTLSGILVGLCGAFLLKRFSRINIYKNEK